jgi:release factor glutamine methyltransferase
MSDPAATPPAPAASPSPAAEVWTVRRVLEWTTGHLQKHGSETPRLDAEILLAHARQCRRIQLYTAYDEPLTDAIRATMKELVKRRAAHEPVAYLVGHREFFSLDFQVTPDVLIPRPDTETLVLELIKLAKALEAPQILDLCTGSGCIAIAAAKQLPTAMVTAVDLSPAALAIATANVAKHQVHSRVTLHTGDLFAPLSPSDQYDLIVSNPPYITTPELATLQVDVRKYEPQLALDGGADGLDIIRRILSTAPRHLKPGGWLLLEIDPKQGPTIQQLAAATNAYEPGSLIKDLNGDIRVWQGQKISHRTA